MERKIQRLEIRLEPTLLEKLQLHAREKKQTIASTLRQILTTNLT